MIDTIIIFAIGVWIGGCFGFMIAGFIAAWRDSF